MSAEQKTNESCNLRGMHSFSIGKIIEVRVAMNKVVPVMLALIPLAAVIGACVSCP